MAIKGHPSFLGKTGRHPEGPLALDDEGELVIAVTDFKGKVRIDFGTEVTWLALGPERARELASILMDVAAVAERGS